MALCAHRLRRASICIGIASYVLAMQAGCGGGPSRHLVALTVQPADVDGNVPGGIVHFSATGTYDQAPTTDANVPAQWTSQYPNVASIDPNTGTATCLTVGSFVVITASAAGQGGQIHASASLNCLIPPSQLVGHCLIDPSNNTMTGSCVAGEIGRCFVAEDLAHCPVGQPAVDPGYDHSCPSPSIYQSDLSSSCTP